MPIILFVFIVQDIAAPGTSKVILIQKPSGEVEPWEVYITTTAPQSELESYFIFVESECVVSYFKLTPCCLFEQPEFSEYIMPREAVAINAANQSTVARRHAIEINFLFLVRYRKHFSRTILSESFPWQRHLL